MHRLSLFLVFCLVLVPFSLGTGEVFTATFAPPSTSINVPFADPEVCIGTFNPGCKAQMIFQNVPTGKYQFTFTGRYFRNPPGSEKVLVQYSGATSPATIPDQDDSCADPWNGVCQPVQKTFTSGTFDITTAGQSVTFKEVSTATLYSVQIGTAILTKVGDLPKPPTINAPNINLPCTGTQTQVTWTGFVSDPDTPISSLTFTAVQEPPITTTLGISVTGNTVTITYPVNTNINERIRYTVRDPEGNQATQIITFTVSGCVPPSGCGLIAGCPVACPSGQTCSGSTQGGCGGSCQPITTGCGAFTNCLQQCQSSFICVGAFPNACGGICQFNTQGCGLVAGCNTACPFGQTCAGSTLGGCGGTCQTSTQGCGILSNCQSVCPQGFICTGAFPNGCSGTCQFNTQGCGSVFGCSTQCPSGQVCVNASAGGCGGSCQTSTQGCGLVAGCSQTCLTGQTCRNSVPGSCGGSCCYPPTWDVNPLPTLTVTSGQFFTLFDLDDFTTDFDNLDSSLIYTVSGQVQLTVFIDPLSHIVSISYPPGTQNLDETLTFTVSDGGCGSASVTRRFIVSSINTQGCGLVFGCQQTCPTGFTCSDSTSGGCGGNCIPSTTGCGLVSGCSQQCANGFNCVGSTAGSCGGSCQPPLTGCGPIVGCSNQCASGFTCTGFAPNSCGGTCTPNNSTNGCGALTSCQPQCAQGFVCSNFMPGGCGGVCVLANSTVGCGALASCQNPCPSGQTCMGFSPGGCGGSCMSNNLGCGSIAGCSQTCPSGFTCSGASINGCGGSCVPINNTFGCGLVSGCPITCSQVGYGYICVGSAANGCGGSCQPPTTGCGLIAGCGVTCTSGQTCVNSVPNSCGGICTGGTNCTQPPTLSPLSDQIINCQQQFQTFDLDNFAQDPDNTDDQLTFTFSGNQAFTVSIDPTTHVVTVTQPMNRDLSETLTFTVRDPCGGTDSRTVTFAVRGCSNPPFFPPIFPPQYPLLPPPLFGQPSECKISTGHGLLMDANCNHVPDVFEVAQLQVAPQVETSRAIVRETVVKQVVKAPRIRQLNFVSSGEHNSKVLVLESRDARSGDSTVFPVKITNNDQSTHSYQVYAEGTEPWGTYTSSEGSVLLIPPGETREVELRVYAYETATAGDKTFRLVVRSGADEEKTDLIVHVLPALQENINPWLVDLLIALGVLIVITFVIILIQRKYAVQRPIKHVSVKRKKR
ncbi:MAG: hypothetical protein AABX70_04820 [Nanoarchaeota archaeon]